MRTFILAAIVLASVECGGSDISEDPPIGSADASVAIDSATPNADAADIDAGRDTPDADPGDRAQAFCDSYETLCGYDGANASRFDDEAACLAAFGGFDAGQRACVVNELDELEIDGMLQHCARAMGTGPCS